MSDHTQGGWNGGTVTVQLDPAEHIIVSADCRDHLWRCRRPDHDGRSCWTRISDTPDPFPGSVDGMRRLRRYIQDTYGDNPGDQNDRPAL